MLGKELAIKRKNELLALLKFSKDPEFIKSIIRQLSELLERLALRKTKDEKKLYCKHCTKPYSKNTKIRIRGFKKDGQKKKQKIVICGNCGKEQRITL